MKTRREIGTHIGMRRWWARKPHCLICHKVRLNNREGKGLCAGCERKLRAKGCTCVFFTRPIGKKLKSLVRDLCPVHKGE